MEARMKSPAMVLPDALQALLALNKAVETDDMPYTTHKLVQLRASQINGCGVCVHMHANELRKVDETDERIYSVAGWRDTPFYTEAERAALALTESMTRLADQSDAVPDPIWDEVCRHYDERARSSLILSIAMINLWNRVNAAVRQVAGDWG
ncbi:carboxymuconolactone decarboxylase family protein [Aestuariispira ectoiniformans]|uniref:carboxymuconolactone decarboxylase family protein n=1 Tax=Aestuariispira ectoiniformans TaxID=2775080 RepID=UPI00223AC7BC|nr:carboxymuconolactone decarboxylase family protein [Aestuariispira ectoiniformans]